MMISNIAFINNKAERLLVSTYNFNEQYGNFDSAIYHKNIRAFYNDTIAVQWEYNNQIITISCEKDKCMRGYITPDSKYMIIAFYMDSDLYPRPNNCVIYNADGTILRIIQYPELISKQALVLKKSQIFYRFIDGFLWVENKKGGYDVAIILCFSDNWYETRKYDYINDVFGECIEEGRA